MSLIRRLQVPPGLVVRVLAVLVFAAATAVSLVNRLSVGEIGLDVDQVTIVVFAVVIVVGELVPVVLFDRHATAPLSTATALALVLLPSSLDDRRPFHGAAILLMVIGAAMLAGAAIRAATRRPIGITAISARFLALAAAALLYRSLGWVDGIPPVVWAEDPDTNRPLVALVMLVVAAFAVIVVQLSIEGILRSHHDQSPVLRAVADEVVSGSGLSTALVSTGALIALGEQALGLAALPLFLSPLLFTQFAVVRYGGIRRTYGETIRALSELTDVAGYTAPGHASRVETLAVGIGRILGLSPREMTNVEYAALLHDLGQVALREPIPGGATVLAAPADQRRIAQDGADIVRQTGVLDAVAVILEAQTTPYRQVREFGEPLPMASRIIKVANAFDDLAGPNPPPGTVRRAMERINLGLGYEYDPHVVNALARVLRRRGDV